MTAAQGESLVVASIYSASTFFYAGRLLSISVTSAVLHLRAALTLFVFLHLKQISLKYAFVLVIGFSNIHTKPNQATALLSSFVERDYVININ